jgi:hypothetical protein
MSGGRQFSAAMFRWQEADTNPDVVAGNCKAVTDAIRDIYAQDMTNIIFGDLYRCIDRSSPSTLRILLAKLLVRTNCGFLVD